MKYYDFDLDVSGNKLTIEKECPGETISQYGDFRRKLEDGKPYPDDFVVSCGMQLGSSKERASDADLLSGAPFISPRLQEVIYSVAGDQVQFVPMEFTHLKRMKYPVDPGYKWLNLLHRVPCTELIYGEEVDCEPDYDGTPRPRARVLDEIRFLPEKVEGLHIFRIEDFWSTIIVSEEIHTALSQQKWLGFRMTPLEIYLEQERFMDNRDRGVPHHLRKSANPFYPPKPR